MIEINNKEVSQMKIIMTNTADHTSKVVSFKKACDEMDKNRWINVNRTMVSYRLLNNENIIVNGYEFRRERLVKEKEVNHDKI